MENVGNNCAQLRKMTRFSFEFPNLSNAQKKKTTVEMFLFDKKKIIY